MQSKKILVIGEVFIDIDITHKNKTQNVHLGGIFHSARTLCAMNCDYGLLYTAPEYLKPNIQKFIDKLNCSYSKKIATVVGTPNLMLISDRYEAGNQNYNEVLRDEKKIKDVCNLHDVIREYMPTDILLYPLDGFNEEILAVCNELKINLHIDMQYDDSISELLSCNKISTLILSTTAKFFLTECYGKIELLKEFTNNNSINHLILKENRGGSLIYDVITANEYGIPCYPIAIKHSVGVGDCYNSIFVMHYNVDDFDYVGKLASYIASLYASTMLFEEFGDLVNQFMTLGHEYVKKVKGQRLPWSCRCDINIYLAAPDFPDVDTTYIDLVEENMMYHGFEVIRPIKRNGLVTSNMSRDDELTIFTNDIEGLEESSLMICILLSNDPGTLVEIGYFYKSNKPVILFDPYKIASNMFLRNAVDSICYTLEDVTEEVFRKLSRGELK